MPDLVARPATAVKDAHPRRVSHDDLAAVSRARIPSNRTQGLGVLIRIARGRERPDEPDVVSDLRPSLRCITSIKYIYVFCYLYTFGWVRESVFLRFTD